MKAEKLLFWLARMILIGTGGAVVGGMLAGDPATPADAFLCLTAVFFLICHNYRREG